MVIKARYRITQITLQLGKCSMGNETEFVPITTAHLERMTGCPKE